MDYGNIIANRYSDAIAPAASAAQNAQKLRNYVAALGLNTTSGTAPSVKKHQGEFLEKLRQIQWSRGYNWFITLEGMPSPFDEKGIGLPAVSFNLPINRGNTFTFQSGMDEFSIPSNTNSLGIINIQLMEDECFTMAIFLESWLTDIYSASYGVLPLKEACKQLTITHESGMRVPLIDRNYDVFPVNELFISGSNTQSDPLLYSVQLQIVDYMNPFNSNVADKRAQAIKDAVYNSGTGLSTPAGWDKAKAYWNSAIVK